MSNTQNEQFHLTSPDYRHFKKSCISYGKNLQLWVNFIKKNCKLPGMSATCPSEIREVQLLAVWMSPKISKLKHFYKSPVRSLFTWNSSVAVRRPDCCCVENQLFRSNSFRDMAIQSMASKNGTGTNLEDLQYLTKTCRETEWGWVAIERRKRSLIPIINPKNPLTFPAEINNNNYTKPTFSF